MRSGRIGLLLPTSLIVGAVYAILTAIVTTLLAFPGFGVIMLPQPSLEVVVGKTIFYSFSGLRAVIWVLYVLATHIIFYYLVDGLFGIRRSYLAVSVILYLVNLVLVLAGASDSSLPFYVYRDTIGRGFFLAGVAITILFELVGCRLAEHILGKLTKVKKLALFD